VPSAPHLRFPRISSSLFWSSIPSPLSSGCTLSIRVLPPYCSSPFPTTPVPSTLFFFFFFFFFCRNSHLTFLSECIFVRYSSLLVCPFMILESTFSTMNPFISQGPPPPHCGRDTKPTSSIHFLHRLWHFTSYQPR